jgi:hypothetical protein
MLRWLLSGVVVLAVSAGSAQAGDVGFGFRLRLGNHGYPADYGSVSYGVWCPPVYETVCRKVWHEPCYETVCRQVWCPPVTREKPYVTGYRTVVLTPGHYKTVHERICVKPGWYEDVHERVLVRAGHYHR